MQAASSLSGIQSLHSSLTLSTQESDQDKQVHAEFLFEDERFFNRENSLYYNDRARISFTLAGEFSSHFILVKGLTEFYRPKHLKFAFDHNRKAFTIDLAVAEINDLSKLLRVVQQELLREISFKAALRRAIEFEKRYRLEAAEVYAYQGV
jgi:hypothetical protein